MAYSINAKDYFNTKLYTGNGSTNAITGVGFATDMTWCKKTNSAQDHALVDAVRGVTEVIYPNASHTQTTDANSLTAFDSDGFTLGSSGDFNQNSDSYASWNWKLGTTSGITTNGSTTITPVAYSFNATTGMSAIKCTGTGAAGLFPHGLGVAPKIVISKRLNDTNSWYVQTDLITSWTSSNFLTLNTTTGVGNSTDIINATDATNVSLASADDWVNKSGDSYIHYCFAEKAGFSKFGTYLGNGSDDGPFIYTGFKVAWLVIKRTDTTDGWFMYDNKRSTFNAVNDYLLTNANSAEVESAAVDVDFLSNGFKLRNDDGGHNNSSGTYLFLAFAEAPVVGSNNIPATAR